MWCIKIQFKIQLRLLSADALSAVVQKVKEQGRDLFTLRVTGHFLSVRGYASMAYFTTIMHHRSENTHLSGWWCQTSSPSHAPDILNVPPVQRPETWMHAHPHTHTHRQSSHVASHISNSPSDTLSPSMLCVLLRPLSAVTDRMTGGRCYESCLGWWPHSWVPPAPHLGTPAASRADKKDREMSVTHKEGLEI